MPARPGAGARRLEVRAVVRWPQQEVGKHLADIAKIDQKALNDAIKVDATADQVAKSELQATLKKEMEW